MIEQLGKYRIDSVLGKGAMGTVYKAFDPHIARHVALKTIRQELLGDTHHQELLSRFQNEAQAAGRLGHPNIVGVYDYGEVDGTAYIVMEYIEGVALSTRLQLEPVRQIAQAIDWMRQLLGALHYAHAKGVIHRDVKPANLIITPDNQVKVSDFGIARLDTSVLTQTGSMIGTPSYMSPEQFCGGLVDGRSDVFSAAIVMYQLITGERPFSGSATMVMQQILNQSPVPPSSLNPTLAPELDVIVSKALAKRPEDRYESALDFLCALESLSADQSSTTSPLDDDSTRLIAPGWLTTGALHSTAPSIGGSAVLDTLTPWKHQVRPELESLLSQQIGPLARLLVRRTLGNTSDFEATRNALLSHIPSERGRGQFVAATAALKQRLEAMTLTSAVQAPQPTAINDAVEPSTTRSSPQGVDEAFRQNAEKQLTRCIGPIARVVVSRALKTVPTRQALLESLAAHISDPIQRSDFLRHLGAP